MPSKIYVKKIKTIYPDIEFSRIYDIEQILSYILAAFNLNDVTSLVKINELDVEYDELETDDEYKKRILKENRINTKRNITKLKLKEIGVTKLSDLSEHELELLLKERNKS